MDISVEKHANPELEKNNILKESLNLGVKDCVDSQEAQKRFISGLFIVHKTTKAIFTPRNFVWVMFDLWQRLKVFQ